MFQNVLVKSFQNFFFYNSYLKPKLTFFYWIESSNSPEQLGKMLEHQRKCWTMRRCGKEQKFDVVMGTYVFHSLLSMHPLFTLLALFSFLAPSSSTLTHVIFLDVLVIHLEACSTSHHFCCSIIISIILVVLIVILTFS